MRKHEPVALTHYLKQIREDNKKLLTEEEEKQYLIRIKQGDQKAREEFIIYNLRLVIKYAVNKKGNGLSLSDLIQYGNMGLMHAIDVFDIEKNNRFSTYAVYWIEAYIDRGIENDSKMIRIPAHYYDRKKKYEITYNQLKEELKREPTKMELAKALHAQAKSIDIFLDMEREFVSLDEEEIKKNVCNAYFSKDTEETFYHMEFYNDIIATLKTIPISEKSKKIFWDLSGLDEEPLSIADAAKKYKVSSTYIVQVRNRVYEYLARNSKIIAYSDKEYDKVYTKRK